MKKLLLTTSLVAISLTLSHFAYAQKEGADYEAREKQAKLLMKVNPPQDLVDQMLSQVARNPQAHFSPEDIKSIEDSMDYTALGKAMEEGLVKNFTVDELKMLAQIYGSPTGKSITHKMPIYMGEIQPVLQTQLRERVMAFMAKRQNTPVPATSAPVTTATPATTAPAAPASAVAPQTKKTGK